MARRPRFTVHHFVAGLEAWVIPPAGVYNQYVLSGVGPVYRRSRSDALTIPELNLYTRFFVSRPGPEDFELSIAVRTAGVWRKVDTYGPDTVHFRSSEPARDHVFRLLNVRISSGGLYRVRLRPLGRRTAATEYLQVE